MKLQTWWRWSLLLIMLALVIGCSDDDGPTGPQQPTDLALTNLSVLPSTVTTRAFTACIFNIVNSGPGALSSEYIVVDFYLSTNVTFGDTDDVKIGDAGFTISIASGATYPINLSSTGLSNMVRFWPENQPAGDYYVFAGVTISNPPPDDPDSSNNYDRTNSTISYDPPPPADLVWVDSVSAVANSQVIVNINMRNSTELRGVEVPLRLSGTDFTIDSGSFIGGLFSNAFAKACSIDVATQTVFLIAVEPDTIASGEGIFASLYVSLAAGAAGQEIAIDSARVLDGPDLHEVVFVKPDLTPILPAFEPGKIVVEP